MGTSIDGEREDELFNALLEVAAKEVMRDEIDALPSLDELNKMYLPSDILDKKVRSMIDREYSTRKRKFMVHRLGKAAAVVSIIFTVGIIVMINVEATRSFIVNTFVTSQHDHVAFEFRQNGVGTDNVAIVVGYLPEGFHFANNQEFDSITITIYSNAFGDEIIIQRHIASTLAMSIDNELREFSIISLNGQEAFLFEAHDDSYLSVIMWQYRNDVFNVYSNISIEELVRVAESISTN